MVKKKGTFQPEKIRVQRARAYRKAHMKKLREMKEKIDKMEKSHEKAIQQQKEMLNAHVKATREMHRSFRGKKPVKSAKK